MYNGEIYNNTASGDAGSSGGGVDNWLGIFNMRGGRIYGNTAVNGGGIDNWQSPVQQGGQPGVLQISDGIIYGNNADPEFKNIATSGDGSAILTGPTINEGRYGLFDGSVFNPEGFLTTTYATINHTIEVVNGELITASPNPVLVPFAYLNAGSSIYLEYSGLVSSKRSSVNQFPEFTLE